MTKSMSTRRMSKDAGGADATTMAPTNAMRTPPRNEPHCQQHPDRYQPLLPPNENTLNLSKQVQQQ